MFRTEINIQPSEHRIGLQSPILSVGSCFADRMGDRLSQNKFLALNNPFGVIFNPISIFRLLDQAVKTSPSDTSLVVQSQGMFYHYDVHSEIYGNSSVEVLAKLDLLREETAQFLQIADWLIITLGTAFVYTKKDSGDIVANCHKVPNSFFNKRLLSIDEIEQGYDSMISNLKKLNPGLKVLLTLSPVRHIKDTLELNSVSKSLLRIACENIIRAHANTFYFPSYEIMMDDLRDYRFYASDMLHTNDVAEEYIWTKFSEAYMEDETIEFISEWEKVRRSLEHRPFHPGSSNHRSFLEKTLEKLQKLHFQADMTDEIRHIEQQLKT